MGIVTFKAMLRRNKRGTLILAIVAVALILGLSAHCKKDPNPSTKTSGQSKEPTKVFESVSTDNRLSDRIKQLVGGLEYPDEVAGDFSRMLMDWKDELGCPILIRWKENLANAHQDYQQGKMSRKKVADIEKGVLEGLCKRIKEQFGPNEFVFELSDVIQNQQANCLGYSQLIYIIGNAIGLSVRPMGVLNFVISPEEEGKKGHIACIIDLFDGQSVMADVAWFFELSLAFKFEDHFVKIGNYWELRDKDNTLLLHSRIRLLDREGLIAAIYNGRGYVYKSKGEFDRSILEYDKAVEIDPRYAEAYNNRGVTYAHKSEFEQAILDFTRAIEIDPKYATAYTNRGRAFAAKREYNRAIADHTKAIEINPKFAEAYNNRGLTYAVRGEFGRAILDFTKAIEINPKFAQTYTNRGDCYYKQHDYDRAVLDLTNAIEINPKDAYAYSIRGNIYHVKNEYDRAILDYTKAIEINQRFVEAYNNRGVAYADKGEYNLAISDYEKAIETDPEYAMAYLNRGEVYAELGKSEEAKKDLLKTIELDTKLKESVKKVSESHKLDLKIN